MRGYRDMLEDRGDVVHYGELNVDHDDSYESRLVTTIEQGGFTHLKWLNRVIAFLERIQQVAQTLDLPCELLPNPNFCTPSEALVDFLGQRKQLKMHDFYLWQRRRDGYFN